MKLYRTLRDKLSARLHPPEPPITITEDGFTTLGTEVRWADVEQIRAFKLDLLTVDEVRFLFVLLSGRAVEISEEQPGFEAAIASAKVHFPSLSGWQDHIIKPAFAINDTVLFQRSGPTSSSTGSARKAAHSG
jgi:hypothetical protein